MGFGGADDRLTQRLAPQGAQPHRLVLNRLGQWVRTQPGGDKVRSHRGHHFDRRIGPLAQPRQAVDKPLLLVAVGADSKHLLKLIDHQQVALP